MLAGGCETPRKSIYVSETDRLFFVQPGDKITRQDGSEDVLPYKGVVLSNEKYMALVLGQAQ